MSTGKPRVNRTSADEFTSITRWLEALPPSRDPVLVGPGDDVAWLRVPEHPLALSADSWVEGTHFRRTWAEPEELAQRAMAAALSDLAAARAMPVGCLLALTLPALDPWADRLMAGFTLGAQRWGCPILGGDTTASEGPAVLGLTVLGTATSAGPLLRSGAQVGDRVFLSGPIGAGAGAVRRLLAGQAAVWPMPQPRIDLVPVLGSATAGIDLSDGLLADAHHLANASKVQLQLHRRIEWDDDALTGGEDYELLVTAPEAIPGFELVGEVLAGEGLSFSDGSALPPKPWGFDHGSVS